MKTKKEETKQQIEDEYDKIKDLALAEYSKITALEYAKYEKIIDLALAEYRKIRDLALAEKERKLEELEEPEDIKIIDGKKYRLVD